MRTKLFAALLGLLTSAALLIASATSASAATAKSQNGWTVITKSTSSKLATYKVPGTKHGLLLRKGDAGVLLVDFANWYNKQVEKLSLYKAGDDYGWSYRKIRGSQTTYSNHASGTAIDLNATRHPLNTTAAHSFTKKQIAAIHKRLKRYSGVIRWGGDYQHRKDPMHFEINKSVAATHKVYKKLFPCHSPTC
ncbi:D-alanyl-D-alanine carboxypeptidase [Jatrophihabitans endophyticus]|uniref:D-alanyl-D-alanine carboxypeptidase n=1 Tax=Jatrophihabitans endophyticus TaxID=1206085 RepID=A0A1M5ISS5_9ACTN|nr:M15 family metallopeptidase [Jatrophihabitans endophyticus]SHG31374.1 D-alanyl-D-alanine carboxypeptidase [Jatrophihabitans endophyticus]